MPSAKLTAASIESIRPRRGRDRESYFDSGRGAVSGLVLRVTSSGARSFWFIYQAERRKRWLRLGEAGQGEDKLTLANARSLAREQRGLLDQRRDPIEERAREERQAAAEERQRKLAAAGTLASAVAAYLDASSARLSPTTIRERERMLDKYITAMPSCSRPVVDLKRFEIANDLRTLGGVQANRVRALLRAASRWSADEERLPLDVMAGVKKVVTEQPRDRVLSDDELAHVWRALDIVAIHGKRDRDHQLAAYVRLLVLCGTRRTETALLRWQDVDLVAKVWRIPAEHRKGSHGRRRALDVPLSLFAVDSLNSLAPAGTGSAFRPSIASAPGRLMFRVRKAAKIKKDSPADFGLHDLRRTAATGWQRCGAGLEVVSKLLGHTSDLARGVAAATPIYARAELWEERQAAAQAWGEHVRGLVTE